MDHGAPGSKRLRKTALHPPSSFLHSRVSPLWQDLADVITRGEAIWKQWYDQESPEQARVPDYEDRLTKFDRMLLVKAFRDDRTLIAATEFIADR